MSSGNLVAVQDPEILRQLEADGPSPNLVPVKDERILFQLNNESPIRKTLGMTDDIGLGRAIGRTARAGLRGAGEFVGMLANAPAGLYNTVMDLYDQYRSPSMSELVTGKQKGPRFADQTQAGSRLADLLGLPKAENATERVAEDMAAAVAGQGGLMRGAEFVARGAGPVAQRVSQLLASQPRSQLIGAAGGAGGASATREGGGGEGWQLAAGLAGGLVAPLAADASIEAVKAGARGLRAAVDPFTQAGRRRVVGDLLNRSATSRDDALAALQNPQEIVPGSAPTTAQQARDEGLFILERGAAAANPQTGARLARRASEQNAARNALLNAMAGDEAGLQAARGARQESASPLYERTFSEAVNPPPALVELSQRPAFGQALQRASQIAAEEGIDLGNPMNTMRGLHYVKLALDDIIEGARRDTSMGRTQQRAIIGTQEKLLGLMDELSPTYRQARESFRGGSQAVNQMETLQGLRAKVQNPGTDAATGEHILSAAQLSKVLKDPQKSQELRRVLTPEQFRNLRAISNDLNQAALSASSGKSAGSNTTQNVSTAYILGQALGGQASENAFIRNLSRPLQFLNKLNEREVQELVTDAMLDPALARQLMSGASRRTVDALGFELLQRARAKGIGAAVGTTTNLRQPEEEATPR